MPRAKKTPRTHCQNGHRLTPSNIYRAPGKPNTRCCRKCRTARDKARREARQPKYNGRGLDWRKDRKPKVNKRQAGRIARYNAGLILDSVLSDGWEPEALIKEYGEEGLEMIKDRLLDIALWLRETGDPDGVSTR